MTFLFILMDFLNRTYQQMKRTKHNTLESHRKTIISYLINVIFSYASNLYPYWCFIHARLSRHIMRMMKHQNLELCINDIDYQITKDALWLNTKPREILASGFLFFLFLDTKEKLPFNRILRFIIASRWDFKRRDFSFRKLKSYEDIFTLNKK